jgi:tight adherence protein C
MSWELVFGLSGLFIAVAVLTGAVSAAVLARRAPERQRINQLAAGGGVVLDLPALTDAPSPMLQRFKTFVPKAPKEMMLLRRKLTAAGYNGLDAAILYGLAKLVIPIMCALLVISVAGVGTRGVVLAGLAAMCGFMMPELWIAHLTRKRQKVIRNGLPDALDLFIVCLEAGSSLDQAIVKASGELEIAYPALAEELRLITTEIRAGKPRLEAFKNFAARTRVDDVRALVAMLVQTDKFGTSVAQALRTHADQARTMRRQRAEEKAAKLSVKLVIPLVFFLFPALYVVVLGPAFIKIAKVFGGSIGGVR